MPRKIHHEAHSQQVTSLIELCKRANYVRSTYSDKQLVRLQESPEQIPEGETPHTLTLVVYDDLVDVAKPGDRVDITGVFRAAPTRVNPRVRTLRATYKTCILLPI